MCDSARLNPTTTSEPLPKLKVSSGKQPSSNKTDVNECEPAEEAVTTDSEEYLSEPIRYRNFQYSTQSSESNITVLAQNMTLSEDTNSYYTSNGNITNIQIPIVGYEIMEERARFTVYKLRIENKMNGDCWYVFRRYTDFVRLCNRLRNKYPQVVQHLPRKRWLKNNFDPVFLEERVNGLQTLVNAILTVPDLITSQEIQDFFCLNEPPIYMETNEESRAMFEAFEETIADLRQQLREREVLVDSLQADLHSKLVENDNLKKLIRNSTKNCPKCQSEYKSLIELLK